MWIFHGVESMSKKYVKFETPKEIVDKLINITSIAKDTGKVRKGINEATKAAESGKAQILIIAEDVDPEEIVMHLSDLCEEKGVAYAYLPTKQELGKAVGLSVSCAAIAIVDAGAAKDTLHGVLERLGKKAKKEEKPSEAKEEKPSEAKKEEKPMEKKEKKPKKK
jgi:large subunit ribosomal protein L7Ae